MYKALGQDSGWIWINGEFVPWQEAKIHVLSHTLHYGSGVFEGERAYNGKIFKMTEHHQRLHDSAAMLGFEIPYTVAEINEIALELLARNHLKDAYIRPVAWHGPESLSVASYKNSVNLALASWQWTSYFPKEVLGVKLAWADWVRPAPNMAPVHAKANGQYISATLSKNKAEKEGFHDALMLDYRGYIAECTGANIFIAKDQTVYTPIADCFLNGITRQTVMQLLKEKGFKIIEKHLMPEEIKNAEEIFITGSAVEVQSVIQIGEQHFPLGAIAGEMKTAYGQLVRE